MRNIDLLKHTTNITHKHAIVYTTFPEIKSKSSHFQDVKQSHDLRNLRINKQLSFATVGARTFRLIRRTMTQQANQELEKAN